jgi:Immunoglobulin domain
MIIILSLPQLTPHFLAVLPQISAFSFGDDSINVDENVAVQCMVLKGDLPIKINWLHNGAPIEVEQGYQQIDISQRISTLNIETLKSFHRGNYTCVARNAAGFTEFSTYLNINGL